MHSLEAIADNLKKHNNKDAKSTSRSNKKVDVKKEDPTFSSGLTGTKWTLDAFSKTLKDMFGINSTNTAAVQEILSLPIKHQVTLLGGITERYTLFNNCYF